MRSKFKAAVTDQDIDQDTDEFKLSGPLHARLRQSFRSIVTADAKWAAGIRGPGVLAPDAPGEVRGAAMIGILCRAVQGEAPTEHALRLAYWIGRETMRLECSTAARPELIYARRQRADRVKGAKVKGEKARQSDIRTRFCNAVALELQKTDRSGKPMKSAAAITNAAKRLALCWQRDQQPSERTLQRWWTDHKSTDIR